MFSHKIICLCIVSLVLAFLPVVGFAEPVNYGVWVNPYTFETIRGSKHSSLLYSSPQVMIQDNETYTIKLQEITGGFQLQNVHITAKIYPEYSVFLNPENTGVIVDDERWFVQRLNKQGKWRNVDLYNPELTTFQNSSYCSVTRSYLTYDGFFHITYGIQQGSFLKHTVNFTALTQDEYQIVYALSGIDSDNVKSFTGTAKTDKTRSLGKTPYLQFFKSGSLILTEYLWGLGETNTLGVWNAKTLKNVTVTRQSSKSKANIEIGSFLLQSGETCFIDPDISTYQVATGNDDTAFDPTNNPNDNRVIFGKSSINLWSYMRWNVSIPDGATVSDANLLIYGTGTQGSAFITQIRLVDLDNCPDFTTDPASYTFDGNVSWDITGWTTSGWNTSPNCSVLVQNFIDRANYTEGYYLALRLDNGNVGSWRYRWGHSYNGNSALAPKLNVTWTAITDNPPQYGAIAYNTTIKGASCNLSVVWNDDVNMSGYIFGWNNTGSFTNDTWTAITPVTNETTVNVIKSISASVGVVLSFQEWANDTSNNWNTTGLQSFTVTGINITFQLNTGGTLYVNTVLTANSTVNQYGINDNVTLLAVPLNASYSFLNYTWGLGNSTSNPYNFTVPATNQTMWCYFSVVAVSSDVGIMALFFGFVGLAVISFLYVSKKKRG